MKTRNFVLGSMLMLATLALAACKPAAPVTVTPPAETAPTASLALSPANGTTHVGETFTTDIVLTSATSVDAIDVVLAYNPELLEIADTDAQKDGIQVKTGTAFESIPLNIARDGELHIGAATLGTGPTGSITVATITFKALAEGTAKLELPYQAGSKDDNDVFVTGSIEDALTSVTSGSFTISK